MDKPNQSEQSWRKQAALFLISQNISIFGSSVVAYTVMWYITLTTSSGIWMMLSTICAMLPQVVISLFGGVLADRYPRKHLIMISDGFIALSTLGLAVAFMLGYKSLWLMLAVSVIRSIGGGIQGPAVNALYPQIVPEEQLTRIQGISQTVTSVLMLLAPAAGGVLLGMVDITVAFFVDVVTAAIAIAVMSFIRVKHTPAMSEGASIFDDLKEGINYTIVHPQLRRMIGCYIISFFLITPAAVLTPLMIERSYGPEVWRLTANEMVWTVGSLLGGAFVALRGNFKDKFRTAALCLVAFGVFFALLGSAHNFVLYLLFMGLAGCFLPILNTAQTVYIQEITDPSMLGRAFSVVQMITSAAMPVAILLFGPLADVIKVEWILIVSGILLAVTGLVYARKPKFGEKNLQ